MSVKKSDELGSYLLSTTSDYLHRLQGGFQKYLHDRVGEDGAFKLTAAAGEVPAAVAKVLGDVDPGFLADVASVPPSADGLCGKGFKFSVYATAPDAESTQEVAELLEAAAADPTPVMEEVQAASGDGQQQLCDLSIAKKGALFFPALTKPGAQTYYQQLYTGAGKLSAPSIFPDVTVVAASEVAPVQKAVAGQRYSIILENFSGPGDVAVELIQGTRSSGTVLTTVPGGMEKGKPVTVEFEAPAPLEDLDAASQGDGVTRAYVRAYYTKIPGLYSQSEVFTLESAAAAPSA